MKNLTIAKKLYALVAVSLFSLILTAVFANIELSQSQERFNVVQNRAIPSILLLDDTNAKTAALRSAVRDYVISGFMNDLVLKRLRENSLTKGARQFNALYAEFKEEGKLRLQITKWLDGSELPWTYNTSDKKEHAFSSLEEMVDELIEKKLL